MGNPIERPNHDPSAGDHHRRESNKVLPPRRGLPRRRGSEIVIRVPASGVRAGDRLARCGSTVVKVASGGQGVVFHLKGGGTLTAPGDLKVAIRQADLETMPLAGLQRRLS